MRQIQTSETWVPAEVQTEDFERDVVVVELVVAERDVYVEREVVSLLEEDALVQVSRFLIVPSQEVHAGE